MMHRCGVARPPAACLAERRPAGWQMANTPPPGSSPEDTSSWMPHAPGWSRGVSSDSAPSSPSGPPCGHAPSPWRPPRRQPARSWSRARQPGAEARGAASPQTASAWPRGRADAGVGRAGRGGRERRPRVAGWGAREVNPEPRPPPCTRRADSQNDWKDERPGSCRGPRPFARPPRRGHVCLALPLPTPRDPIQRKVSAREAAGGNPWQNAWARPEADTPRLDAGCGVGAPQERHHSASGQQ